MQWTEEDLAGENPRRRVFIDATVTEESEGLERVFYSAEKHPANAILTPEMLLDRNNNVLPAFSREDCVPFSGDSTNHILEWKTKRFPAELMDADKKVMFFMMNADLYSCLPADIDAERDQGNRRPA